MDSRLKDQRQVALIWMNDANMAAAESEPRGMLSRLASRHIGENHLNKYFEMIEAKLSHAKCKCHAGRCLCCL
jgi:hypothetical protein